ncbi:MAG: hypothetical protein H8K09_13325 [Nitrospira sp.]|nr:hypothetical protein [Nitrospira sp.]
MTCPRCSGLLVPETVHDGALSEDLLRCVNCGRMAKEGEMPKFNDEAHRERWMEGQRLAREAKKKQTEKASAPPCTSVVQTTKPVKKVATFVESIVVSPSSLDEAIAKVRGDLEALERAKEIVRRISA